MPRPTCFLAGTPVVVSDDSAAQSGVVSAAIKERSDAGGQDWLLAVGMVMVGIAASAWINPTRNRRNEEDDSIRQIFGDDRDAGGFESSGH